MDVTPPLIGNTLILGLAFYLLVLLLATLLAMACVLYKDSSVDRLVRRVGIVIYYLPSSWFGVALILIFSIHLKWFPSSDAYNIDKARNILNHLRHMVLPLVVMIVSHLWYYAYMIRDKLLDELRQNHVFLVEGKGLMSQQIVQRHCLRNVALTTISIVTISIPYVLNGTYIAEAVFSYPGIGVLPIESTKYHNYSLLMLLVLVTDAPVVLSSMTVQTINKVIDPRMKETGVSTWQR